MQNRTTERSSNGIETVLKPAPYPSDLSDATWQTVAVVIPPEKDRGRHRSTSLRDVINGINYRWTTGCTWRMLPHDFPPWATVYTYFRQWQRDGTLNELRDALLRRRDACRPSTIYERQKPAA